MLNHNKRNNGQNEPKKGFRPFAYVFAFFNPVSREDLKESFDQFDKKSSEVSDLLKNSKELHRKIDESLMQSSISPK